MGGGYEEIGGAGEVTNVNPLTGDILSTLMGQLEAGGAGAEQLISQLGSYDFLSVLEDPRLQGAIGQFAGERNTLAEQAAQNAQQQISGSFAGTGLYSGAFGEAVGAGVGQAYQQGATDIAGIQQGLYGQALGVAGQQQAGALNYYGGLGQAALGGIGAIGRPEFYSPTYVEGGGGIGAGMAGASAGFLPGFLLGGPVGGAVGGGLGFLGGLFS